MKRPIMLAASALLMLAGNAQAKDCEVWPIFLIPHGTAESRITVKAGSRCVLTMNGGSASVSETRITQNPGVGKAGVSSNRVIYEAKPGFAGSDEFTYSREGFDQTGKPAPMAVHLKVDVVP